MAEWALSTKPGRSRPGLRLSRGQFAHSLSLLSFQSSSTATLQTDTQTSARLRQCRPRQVAAIEQRQSHTKLPKGFRPLHIHRIEAGSELVAVTASSKLNIESGFVRHLQEIGRNAAHQWLAKNGKMIGKGSSFDPLGGMPLFPDSSRPEMGLGTMVGRLKRLAS